MGAIQLVGELRHGAGLAERLRVVQPDLLVVGIDRSASLILMMAVANLDAITRALMAGGMPAATPAAVIADGASISRRGQPDGQFRASATPTPPALCGEVGAAARATVWWAVAGTPGGVCRGARRVLR